MNDKAMTIEELAKSRIHEETIFEWNDEFILYFGDFGDFCEGKAGYCRYEDALEAEIEWLKENVSNGEDD